MTLQHIKMTAAGLWVMAALVIAQAIDRSWPGGLVLAVFGLLPPLAILLLWNEPAETMSERIREARRRT